MAHDVGLSDRNCEAPKRTRRKARPEQCVEAARAYTQAVAVAWWDRCQPAHDVPAMSLPAIDHLTLPARLPAMHEAEAHAMGAELSRLTPRDAAFRLGQLYCSMLPEAHRGANGIFYTPPALTSLLLDRAEEAGHDWRVGRVVDPSCGAGALMVEAAGRMAAALGGADDAGIVAAVSARLLGWDVDPFAAWLAQVSVEVALLPHVLASGTRLGPVTSARDSLADWTGHAGAYALVMGNPPFGRVKDTADIRVRFRRSLHGHPNLYTLFTDLAVHLAAAESGIIAYIMPAGYLGGRYSSNLRRVFASVAPPASIDIVGSRDGVFEGVLQEVALGVFRRGPRRGAARCAKTLVGGGRARSYPTGDLMLPCEAGAPWLVPREPGDAAMVRRMHSMPSRLSDWGYAVATGPLVWNRSRARLHGDARRGCVPVIWAGSVGMDGRIHPEPATRRATAYYRPDGPADPNLVSSPCLLVRRTTSKEQRRRLVSAILPCPLPEGPGAVCVENHLNMIRATDDRAAVPLGTLAAFFASITADRVFRCISGSVAVSTTELAAMPLPPARDIVEAMASADPERALRCLYDDEGRQVLPLYRQLTEPAVGGACQSIQVGSPPGTRWPQLRFPSNVTGIERENVLMLMDHLFGTPGGSGGPVRPDVLGELIRLGGRTPTLRGPALPGAHPCSPFQGARLGPSPRSPAL